jgi:hypothetical protein
MRMGIPIWRTAPDAISTLSMIGINHHWGPTEGRLDESNSPLETRAEIRINKAMKPMVESKNLFASTGSEYV